MPTIFSSEFQTLVACLIKQPIILGGEKRRLLPGSAFGQAGEHIGSVKSSDSISSLTAESSLGARVSHRWWHFTPKQCSHR